MTMRKVLIFALVVAIALGGLGFAHAAVTDSQDELVIYPTLEVGDSTVLDGRSAEMTFTCGDHLLWNSTYDFGGGTDTAFLYDAEGIPGIPYRSRNTMDFWISAGMSASTSGSFFIHNYGYGPLFQAVSDETPTGGSRTMKLRMADYVDYYVPDFELSYQEFNRQCHYSMNFWNYMDSEDWFFNNAGIYESFLKAFRFPVQEDHLVDITIIKDDAGRPCSFDFYTDNGPELGFISHVGSEGIWFVPLFRDSSGNPLPYESPDGHGVYFIPWQILYTYDTWVDVAPNFSGLRRVIPLSEDLLIDHIEIDGTSCRMLTREGGSYILSTWDLTTGTEITRLEVLPHDPAQASYGEFLEDEGYLLITAQNRLALLDPDAGKVLLTAPDISDQRYQAAAHNPDIGALRFDGERLYLLNTVYSHHDGAFWTAVWQEGELLHYAEFDCSLMQGNNPIYYREITLEAFSLNWK
jgi:hypothetical protein